MFRLVPTVQTKFSRKDLCKSIILAWFQDYGKLPSKQSVGVIVSQNSIETGKDYCWNWNIGNSKVGNSIPGQEIKYMMLKGTWEIINGKKVIFEPPHRATWFRAFDNLDDGVRNHLELLRNNRYKTSWTAIEQGNVELFATLLKQNGYYTAPLKDYIAGMKRFYDPYIKSYDYETAISELQFVSPPLQPWVDIKTYNLPELDFEVANPKIKSNPIQPNIFSKVFGALSKWIKPKS